MGEARNKSRSKKAVIAAESRCVYCNRAPKTLEHMPPISLFAKRDRPSGLEFACCDRCNRSSRAADAAAAFFARMSPDHAIDQAELETARRLLNQLRRLAPRFADELFDPATTKSVWKRGRSSIYGPMKELQLDGPITTELMRCFGSKLGMALFREHTGMPLPPDGRVYARHYFNNGLARDAAKSLTDIMPLGRQLEQGKKTSGDKFFYRYNTDNKTIVAALCGMNSNLFFQIFAVSDPIYFDVLDDANHFSPVGIGDLESFCQTWQRP